MLEPIFDQTAGQETWTTLVDIGVVSYLIYRTLLLIQGTRAVQMLVGILLLILVFFISSDDYIGLPTVHWLLDKFIASFIIVIVVIFQEDIRRALTQVGKGPIVTSGGQLDNTVVLDEIVKGVMRLSQNRMGAILALERTADLGTYFGDGVRLDAQVSKELIYSTFVPAHQNTIHDGAMIIQRGRISHVGCFLPLTVNPKVGREIGTRHRAAIGLTEETDACVIVVSEETGTISVAGSGEMLRDFNEGTLRSHLDNILVQESRSAIWRRFRKARQEEEA